MPSKPRCSCTRVQRTATAENFAKTTILSLLTGSHSSGPRVRATNPAQCRTCKVASNRHALILPTHSFASLGQRDTYGDESRAEIRDFIWGGGESSGSDDADAGDGNEVLVNRIYSMLLLENSAVIDYLEDRSGPGLDEMPQDMRKHLERAIAAQVQMS